MTLKRRSSRVASMAATGLALSCVLTLSASAPDGGGATRATYELSWSTIDGGGVTFATGGDFALGATSGQGDAHEMSVGSYTLTGGFWFYLESGDCNTDGAVDRYDFELFADCASGPGGGLLHGCECFDEDLDADIDLHDFARFQANFTGP